jgi:hypothetical protein
MGCEHTYQRKLAIQGCGSLKHIHSIVEKIREDNQKVGKTDRTISQTFTQIPKHDKIQVQWALNIMLNNMLEKV